MVAPRLVHRRGRRDAGCRAGATLRRFCPNAAEEKVVAEFVRLEVEDGIATIRLDRPKMNALNRQVQAEIGAAAQEAAERRDVAAVVVYGGEKVFAAGADVKEMATMSYTDMVDHSVALQAGFTAVAPHPEADRRGDHRLRARRRLRARAVLRLPRLRRRRQARASRRSCSGSSRAPAAPSGCRG
jgi:enoyl-CoA hydratase/carnithine racemase